MYRYDEFDETMVRDRVAQFADQVERRVAGEITEDQFKPLRLMNGLYLQLHAYMLRIAVPYGVLSAEKLRKLAHIARAYDKGYGHFTTRQNLQLNWIKLPDVPAILGELADVEMHAIQTSGNCIRNVTSDQFAAAAPDEVDDPRVWCEIVRQYSTFHPEFSFLPRKFKISVTAAETDRVAIRVNDIGLHLKRTASGELAFDVYVGGGQGRTPYVGPLIGQEIPAADLLSYLEACLRVYNRYGRRDNSFKARIKILVSALGPEEYARQVHAEWEEIRGGALALPQVEIDRIRAYF
jgi:sulfite reductase (NADPH) hemoprotein beta-component